MHYISTRDGRSRPERLSFDECCSPGWRVTAGFSCRRTWPRFDAAQIRALAGRSYAEIAVRGDDARSSARRSTRRRCARLVEAAYAGFDHAAVAPLKQLGAGSLAARAVPRPDAGLQGLRAAAAWAGCSTMCWRSAASASPSSAPPRAIPARRRSRPAATATRVDIFILYPQGPHLRGAAPADDDGRVAECRTPSPSRAPSTIARTW